MEKFRIVHEDGTVMRLCDWSDLINLGHAIEPGTDTVLVTMHNANEMLNYVISFVKDGMSIFNGWDHISSVQTCDDCSHPHAWHYTCYSGALQGCSFTGCKCTGFFAYIEDPSEVAE